MEDKNINETNPTKPSKKNWTWIGVIVLLLLIGLLARGIKRYNVYREGHAKFTSTDASFTVDYPRTWDVQVGNRGAIEATFVNSALKQTNGENAYIHIAKGVIGSTDVEQAFNEAMQKYKTLFKKMEVVAQDNAKVGGEPAKTVVFNGTLGGKTVGYAIVVFVHQGTTYVITANGPIKDYKEVQDELKNMIASWEFANTQDRTVPKTEITTGSTQETTDIVATGTVEQTGNMVVSGNVVTTGTAN